MYIHIHKYITKEKGEKEKGPPMNSPSNFSPVGKV